MPKPKVAKNKFGGRIKLLKNRRARVVTEFKVKNSSVNTDDVQDTGLPIVTSETKDENNKDILSYKFAEEGKISFLREQDRKHFSKDFKDHLIEKHGSICCICLIKEESGHLQIGQRIPYGVLDEIQYKKEKEKNYFLLCGSCNRSKSLSCDTCKNYKEIKDPNVCKSCYWASPEKYNHIAMKKEGRIELVFTEELMETYNKIKSASETAKTNICKFVIELLKKSLN
jgi:hypothetical protein